VAGFRAFISGSTVDLVQVVEDEFEGEPPQPVADTVRRYEIELDRLLIQREEMRTEMAQRQFEILEEGGNFFTHQDEFTEMFDRSRELDIKVRDLNERYARLVTAAMASEGDEVMREFNRRSLPQVYGRSYAEEAFDTVLGLEDLTDDQREQVEGLRSEYEREASIIRDKWAAALKEWQADVELMQMFGGGAQGGGPEAREQADAKQELDERFYARVREILTKEQRDVLPERETDGDWRNQPAFER